MNSEMMREFSEGIQKLCLPRCACLVLSGLNHPGTEGERYG
jgi:hypothetical protein